MLIHSADAKGEMMEWEPLGKPGHLINRAARAFAKIGEARLKPHGFGIGHLPVLVALKDGNALSQGALARFARIEQPSMAQMLARMERDALLEREPDPTDGRSTLISLTEGALARLPAVRDVLVEGNREAMDGFSEEDAATLAALLLRLLANLERVEDRQEASP